MPASPAPNRRRVDRFFWDRGHFRRSTVVGRWKIQLCALFLLASVGWPLCAELLLPEEKRHQHFTHGPVVRAHAAWNNRCDACHVSYSSSDLSLATLTDVHGRWHDFRCETCHHGTEGDAKNYAPHHISARANGANVECGFCHREHQGQDHSLVQRRDGDCTQCHRDLERHHVEQKPTYTWKHIDRFEGGRTDSHGEFMPRDANGKFILLADEKLAKKFGRTLKFDHALHLLPGMASDAVRKGNLDGVWSIGKIDRSLRERYRVPGQADGEPVQLNCASCHQLDGGREDRTDATASFVEGLPREAVLPARPAGAYMLPIVYEKHCQACHPIEGGPVGIPLTGISIDSVKLPHRLTEKQIEKRLDQEFLSKLARLTLKPPSAESSRHDRLDPRVDEDLKKLRTFDDVTNVLVAQALKQLEQNSCGKCHQSEPPGAWNLLPPNSPPIWYPHAKFNHSSHRALECAGCHSRQFPKDETGIELLNLPGIENCRQCHSPAHRVEVDGKIEPRGGVRHACIDCHRYHNGDFALQGLGSPHRDLPEKVRQDAAGLLLGRPRARRESP
jgi:hypothetical protein